MNLGIIEISSTIIKGLNEGQETSVKTFELLNSVFFPIAINHDKFERVYKYLGYCKEFEPVIEGENYPTYEVKFYKNDNKYTVTFKKL